ncbi:MAG: hypothetical protein HDR88_14055 [Bacteroides sp.]|nr:hypothetical protein [Bacteroides sp.]
MDSKTYFIPFKARSGKSDYACSDGEIAGAINLYFQNGSLKTGNNNNTHRLPPSSDMPFINGVLQKPPLQEVEFTLVKGVVDGWHIHSDMLPSKIMAVPSVGKNETPDEHDWDIRAMEALADFELAAKRQNLFTQPFFVMTAWRLADGSHLCPSPPMLMIPNSGAPMVEGSTDFSVDTMKMSLVASACRLQWRVKIPDMPENWNSIVTHLDIFVSSPIALYDPKGTAKGYHRVECKNFTHCVDSDGNAGEHRIHSSVIVQGWQIPAIDDAIVTQNILSIDSFFLISRIPTSQLSATIDFENVKFNCGGLPILSSMESYVPDFAHLSDVMAEGQTLFSGIITAWNLHITPPLPLPLSLSTPYTNTSTHMPRWVFHPDPEAYSYPYIWGSFTHSLPLCQHPKMRGSFYWRGFDPSATIESDTADIQNNLSESRPLDLPGGVWRSVKGSCLLFPDNRLMRLDVRQVIAVCRAFRASGLVATTSPTAYAFTSEGVFLLKEMDDGTFRDAGLICGYRLRDASSLELLPTGVRFVTDNGEIVVIEGTKVSLCSDVEAVSDEDDSWKKFIPEEWNFNDANSPTIGNCGIVVTRPLKLTTTEDRKHLRSISIIGTGMSESVSMAIYGSLDLTRWQRIALADRSTVTGIWGAAYRFFRVAIKIFFQDDISVEGIVIDTVKM